MSRFFKSLGEEEEDMERKTRSVLESENENISIGDKKLNQLELRVKEIMNNPKNIEKSTRKLLSDIKKYTKYFKNDRVPEYMVDLLKNPKVLKYSSLKSLIGNFLKNYPLERSMILGDTDDIEEEEDDDLIEFKDNMKDKKENEKVEQTFEITCEMEKEKQLVNLLNTDISDTNKYKIIIALLIIYKKNNDSEKMIFLLEKYIDWLKNNKNFMKMFGTNINVYLGVIYENLNDKYYDRYIKLLDNMKELNENVIESRKLEFEFFKLGKNIDTNHTKYRLLYFIRNNDLEAAESYFIENEDVFIARNHNNRFHNEPISDILQEFLDFCLKNESFFIAFKILEYFYENNMKNDDKLLIYSLCVILNDKIKDRKIFVEFLQKFKLFDYNKFLLKSENKIDELFRSFFLFHLFDYEAASKIILDITGINCYNTLKNAVEYNVEALYT